MNRIEFFPIDFSNEAESMITRLTLRNEKPHFCGIRSNLGHGTKRYGTEFTRITTRKRSQFEC